MAGLAAADAPDLVRDFADPLYVDCMRDVFGLSIADDAAFLRDMTHARAFTEPLLRLRQMIAVQEGYRGIVATVPISADLFSTAADQPPTLASVILRQDLPAGVDARMLVASLTIAAHTAAQSLAFALWGLLQRDESAWRDVAAPDWADRGFGAGHPRLPVDASAVPGGKRRSTLGERAVEPGDFAVMDIPDDQSLASSGGG